MRQGRFIQRQNGQVLRVPIARASVDCCVLKLSKTISICLKKYICGAFSLCYSKFPIITPDVASVQTLFFLYVWNLKLVV